MAEIKITIGESRNSKAKCGYCLDFIDGEVWICDGCRCQLHSLCYDELNACTTLGCVNQASSSDSLEATRANPMPARRRRRRRRRRVRQPLSERLGDPGFWPHLASAIFSFFLMVMTLPLFFMLAIFGIFGLIGGFFEGELFMVGLGCTFGAAMIGLIISWIVKWFRYSFNYLRR
jgi:hypothetical protein